MKLFSLLTISLLFSSIALADASFPLVKVIFVRDINSAGAIVAGHAKPDETKNEFITVGRIDLTDSKGLSVTVNGGGAWYANSLKISTWHPKTAKDVVRSWKAKLDIDQEPMVLVVKLGRFSQAFRGAPGAGTVNIGGVYYWERGLKSLAETTLGTVF